MGRGPRGFPDGRRLPSDAVAPRRAAGLRRAVADGVAVFDARGRAGVDRLADLVLERALSSRVGSP